MNHCFLVVAVVGKRSGKETKCEEKSNEIQEGEENENRRVEAYFSEEGAKILQAVLKGGLRRHVKALLFKAVLLVLCFS